MKCFHKDVILEVRKALKDDAAGNKPCSMTDLDLAYDMLGELLSMKDSENKLISMCNLYFSHPNKCSKTKKKRMRGDFRDVLKKLMKH